ncbi:hypothetical protein ACFYRY_40390 [Streptomyces sp. NPDC005263]
MSVRNITMDRMEIDGARAVLQLVGLKTDRLRGVRLSSRSTASVCRI